jgi:hypothetical protein
MNFIEAKNLKIKCICNNYLDFHSENQESYLESLHFHCKNSDCKFNISKFLTYAIAIYSGEEVHINITKDSGFITNKHAHIYYNDEDIILSYKDIIEILKLCDFNKYIEKYNNLILFK